MGLLRNDGASFAYRTGSLLVCHCF